MEKKFEEMDMTELKVAAYDLISTLEKTQAQLNVVNALIGRRMQEPVAQVPAA